MRNFTIFLSCTIVSYILLSCGYTHLKAPEGIEFTRTNLFQKSEITGFSFRKTEAGKWELKLEKANTTPDAETVKAAVEGAVSAVVGK